MGAGVPNREEARVVFLVPEQQAARCQLYLGLSARVRLGWVSSQASCMSASSSIEEEAGRCGDVNRIH